MIDSRVTTASSSSSSHLKLVDLLIVDLCCHLACCFLIRAREHGAWCAAEQSECESATTQPRMCVCVCVCVCVHREDTYLCMEGEKEEGDILLQYSILDIRAPTRHGKVLATYPNG